MYRVIQTKTDGSEHQIHWNMTTIVIEDEFSSREEEIFDYVTVTNFNIQYLQSLGVPQFIIDEIGTDEVIEGVEPIETPKRGIATFRNVQQYKDFNQQIGEAKGYPNHSNGTERYSDEEPTFYVDGLPAMLIESNTTEIVGEEVVEDFQPVEPSWEEFIGVEIEKDKKMVFKGKLYKVNQKHTPQAHFPPDQVESLYSEVDFDGEISEWCPVTGAHNSYSLGSQCLWNGVIHTSLIDNNAYPPSYTTYWQAESNSTYPVWVQPTGAHNTYKIGNIVWYPTEGSTLYKCVAGDASGNNSWSPLVYGWEVYTP